MAIKKKKKVYQQPPAKYYYEKVVPELSIQEANGYDVVPFDVTVSQDIARLRRSEKAPLYAVSWGWNACKRAGNATELEVREPSLVQRSIKHNYITGGAGKHHSVLVSDDGIAFTYGEGRSGQLGIGTMFSDHLGGFIQSFPRESIPTGAMKTDRAVKRDIKLIEIACGSNFSIGRELSTAEALHLCVGWVCFPCLYNKSSIRLISLFFPFKLVHTLCAHATRTYVLSLSTG